MLRIWLMLVCAAGVVAAQMLPWQLVPKDFDEATLPALHVIDARELRFDEATFTEISDLAYDGEKQLLYAVSDRGVLHTLHFDFNDNGITALELRESHPLRNKKDESYAGKKADSEGMDLMPDGRLLVSFERKPRVLYFDRTGRKLGKAKLAKPLRDIGNYKGKNKALEAVAFHLEYGVLTLPERPLESEDERFHTLYGQTRQWRFAAHASATAIEPVPGGDLLVLERDFTLLPPRQVITLSQVSLKGCAKELCSSRVVARFDSDAGWKLDNFEGLTRLRDNFYLMISDDNGSPLQRTLLVLFRVSE